jgi:hypothetical protein
MSQEIKNNFESKCSFKIETNSRACNTTVHVYQGCSKNEIDETIENTIYAHLTLQSKLMPFGRDENKK